jgi:hypothetical protein
MALIEKEKVDQIEILENNTIQVRTATIIEKDNVEISRNFHRHVLVPGSDLTGQDPKVISIANLIWTDAVVAEYQSNQDGIQS